MKYIVINKMSNIMDIEAKEFATAEDAIAYADNDYNLMSDNDKKHLEYYYILESVNPDEEAENHFDGDTVKTYK